MPFLSTSGHAMERMRDDLLRRARSERQQRDLEEGPFQQSEREMTETRQNHTGSTAPRLFGEIPREEVSTSDMPREMNMLPMEEVESPKSPDWTGGRRATRFTLPRMSRIWSRGPPREQTQETMDPAIESQLPLADRDNWAIPSPPQPATHPHSTIRAASSYYSETEGPDTASIRPSSRETDEDRRRRRRGRQRRERGRDGRRKRRGKPPQRFLYCFPWVKSKRMRAYIVRCFVSGLFLVILLTVYLALSVSNQISMGEFTIVLILIVILATLFFCFGLIKLCMLVMRKDRARERRAADGLDGHGYAVPDEPIQVTLARDEEAAGIESETSKTTPPAYGVWRESVVSCPGAETVSQPANLLLASRSGSHLLAAQ